MLRSVKLAIAPKVLLVTAKHAWEGVWSICLYVSRRNSGDSLKMGGKVVDETVMVEVDFRICQRGRAACCGLTDMTYYGRYW